MIAVPKSLAKKHSGNCTNTSLVARIFDEAFPPAAARSLIDGNTFIEVESRSAGSLRTSLSAVGDFNVDGQINTADFRILADYRETRSLCPASIGGHDRDSIIILF